MKLTSLNATEISKKLKVTIQKSGKLGFNRDTAEMLNLSKGTYFHFYKDEDNEKCPIVVIEKEKTAENYACLLGGGYFNLNTADLFDHLGIEYKKNNVLCELVPEPQAASELGVEVAYRLVPRPSKSTRRKESTLFDGNTLEN